MSRKRRAKPIAFEEIYGFCRNCKEHNERQDMLGPWCTDCIRAFLKGVAAALGTCIGARLGGLL